MVWSNLCEMSSRPIMSDIADLCSLVINLLQLYKTLHQTQHSKQLTWPLNCERQTSTNELHLTRTLDFVIAGSILEQLFKFALVSTSRDVTSLSTSFYSTGDVIVDELCHVRHVRHAVMYYTMSAMSAMLYTCWAWRVDAAMLPSQPWRPAPWPEHVSTAHGVWTQFTECKHDSTNTSIDIVSRDIAS